MSYLKEKWERETVSVASSTEQSRVNNWSGIWNAHRHIGNFWRPSLIGRTDSYWRGNGEVSGQHLHSLSLRWNRHSRVKRDTPFDKIYGIWKPSTVSGPGHKFTKGLFSNAKDIQKLPPEKRILGLLKQWYHRRWETLEISCCSIQCWASLKRAGWHDRDIFILWHCRSDWYRQQYSLRSVTV